MTTQVLIVHGQLPFAIKLKQALERSTPFEAHPFTSVEAAVDYLSEHVQDVAVVDFAMMGVPGAQIVTQIHEVQPNLAVIAVPRLDADQMKKFGVVASLDEGFSARDLLKIINDHFAQNERPSSLPPGSTALLSRIDRGQQSGAQQPVDLPDYTSLDDMLAVAGTNIFEQPIEEEGDTPPSAPEELLWEVEPPKPESSFDDVLNSLQPNAGETDAPRNPFTDLVNSMRTEEAHRSLPSRQNQLVEFILSGGSDSLIDEEEVKPPPPAPPEEPAKSPLLSAFERLAQEEPPPPNFEESGTVGDLVEGVQDRSFRNVLSILRGEEVGEGGGQEEEEIAPPSVSDFAATPRREPGTPRPVETYAFDDDDDDEPTPAKVILQRTLDQTLSGGNFSLEELLANIDAQLPLHRPKVQPLPSWLRDQQRPHDDAFLVREPDFLPEELPDEPTPVEASEDLYPDQTTQPARGQQIEAHPEALETEWLEHPQRASDDTLTFPETLPEEVPAEATVIHEATVLHKPVVEDEGVIEEEDFVFDEGFAADEELVYDEEAVADEGFFVAEDEEDVLLDETLAGDTTGVWYNLPEQDFNTQFELMAAFEVLGETGVSSGALYTEMPVEPSAEVAEPEPEPEPVPAGDPYLAQLALSLTEVSLELTAEATLLARDQQIVAYAGQMPTEEIEELRGTIADDWDAAPGEVRIRFITAKESGKDYMLYSRRTEDDFTLSLIFAGTTPLRDIRRQGKRLVDALLSVPEAPAPAPEAPRSATSVEQGDTVTRTPYACVWLLSDPGAHLDTAVAQAISAGLNLQMREQHWTIQTLQVHEDYVYVLADVPGETPAYQIIRELKRRSAEIAHAQNPAYVPEALWADSYLVVTPGRELDIEEIQQFINFDRME